MRNANLMAALALASLAGLSEATQAVPAPRKGGSRLYMPTRPRADTALQREIAEWNAEICRRKAEKRARLLAAP